MNIPNTFLLFLCLLMLNPESIAQETKKPKMEKVEVAEKPTARELDIQGLWAAKDQDRQGDGFLMGKGVSSVRISKDGTKYLVEIFGEMVGAYRTLAIREGDQLKTGQVLIGDMIFSDDGERAYLGGSELRRVPDNEVREFVEEQELGSIRAAVIMNVRNCQQAMRGEQNMKELAAGDSFTKKDLEEYMQFPEDIKVEDGVISFKPGAKVMPESADPAVNGDHLWLKIVAPETKDNVGKYGFKDITETTGW